MLVLQRKYLIILSALSLNSVALTQEYTYDLLSNTRPSMTFPVLSDQERADTTQQASVLLEKVFVHQDAKLQDLNVDVAQLGRDFVAAAPGLNNNQFFDKLGATFLANRDLHTNYMVPMKILCYRNLLPFTLERIAGDKIVVSAVRSDEPIVNLAPSVRQIAIGDELLEYSDKPVLEAVAEKSPLSAGANADAYFNGGVRFLAWTTPARPIPGEDRVKLVFAKNGVRQEPLELPWITRIDPACLARAAGRVPREISRPRPRKPFHEGISHEQVEFQALFGEALRGGPTLLDTAEPEIKYAFIGPPENRVGWLRLNSFAPAVKGADDATGIVEDILANKFRQTRGLIIDLRSNPGGNILYADRLAQLFLNQEKELIQFRLRATEATRYLFANQKPQTASTSLPMLQKIEAALAAGQSYTETFPIGLAAGVHRRGTAYFQPVILLTNGSCYSSCDMFAATLQDYGRVHVVGVDHTTGAGGANVWTTTDLVSSINEGAPNNPFRKLPQNQEMRVAIRQTVRGQAFAGQLLENKGVVSGTVMRSTLKDITDRDSERIPKLLSIVDGLPKNPTSIFFESREDVLNLDDQAATLRFEASAIDRIQLYQDETLIAERMTAGDEITIPLSETGFQNTRPAGVFKLRALHQDRGVNRQVAVLKKSFRLLPASQSLPLSFEDPATVNQKVRFYNFTNRPEDGWNYQAGAFRVGNGELYASGLNAELGFQFTAAAGHNLSYKYTLSSEKDWDFFEVLVLVDGKSESLSGLISGDVAETPQSFDLSRFAGKKIIVLFRFTSDDNTESRGVTVKDLVVR